MLLAPVVRPAKAQLVTPLGCFLAPIGSIKPWFHNWGKLAAMLIIPSSWGSPTSLIYFGPSSYFSGAVAGESRTSSQGESLITNLFTLLFLFCLVYFCFVSLFLYQKHKKLVLLVCFLIPKHKKIKSPLVVTSSLAHHVDLYFHPERSFNW